MNSIASFKMGSSYFFDNMEGYVIKDRDELHIMDEFIFPDTNVVKFKNGVNDIFMYRNMSKDEFIKDTLESGVNMRIGKFLIPEFCEYIGFEIKDYEKLKDMFENIESRHHYEILIRDAYIQNNSFTLTDEQRQYIYEDYLKHKNDTD